jgi:hypothetical protein
MTADAADDLRMLREAARGREWNTAQDTLKRLLARLDPLIALTVAAERSQAFLPVFMRQYPDAGWVRELMLTVIAYASAPNDLPDHAVGQFPSPGCGNFLKSVLDMARAVQTKYTVFERYSHITNAVANAILAELSHLYYQPHADAYALLMDAEADAEARSQVQFRFWLDPAVAAKDTALWLAVADDVENKL